MAEFWRQFLLTGGVTEAPKEYGCTASECWYHLQSNHSRAREQSLDPPEPHWYWGDLADRKGWGLGCWGRGGADLAPPFPGW